MICLTSVCQPTSGLDARAAMEVMSAIKRLAEMGRTIIATIHQPSTQLFTSTFDYLLLLKKGAAQSLTGSTEHGCLSSAETCLHGEV